jgi:ElaB/YqjD/DUF883 family membrane-anchored ribosome-binding protein
MTYDKQYFNNKKQELQQDNFKNILEAYDDILRVMQKSVAKTQDINKKFQKVVEEEKASQEQTKKQVAEPAGSKKKP